jgi:hypothetical protein
MSGVRGNVYQKLLIFMIALCFAVFGAGYGFTFPFLVFLGYMFIPRLYFGYSLRILLRYGFRRVSTGFFSTGFLI